MVKYTPRQELVRQAAIRLSVLRRNSSVLVHPRVAIDQILDECRACPPKSLGQEIRLYYLSATDKAIHRLYLEVLKGLR